MSFFEDFRNRAVEPTLLCSENAVELYQFLRYRYFCSGAHIVQGAVDTQAPAKVQSPVVAAMLASVHLKQPLTTVLNLGLGCGAIERYLHASHPALSVVTVDNSIDMITLCAKAGLLPEGCSPILSDAADYLEHTTARFDAVFCDLAIGGQQPDMLRSEGFYRGCMKRMNSGSVLTINILCDDNQGLREVCLAARRVFAWTALVEVPGFDNIVLFAASSPPAITIGEHACHYADDADSAKILSRVRILP